MAGWPNRSHGCPPAGRIYPHSAMSSQYIFTMYKLSRTHPPDKQVLKDISLSFMPGAKIGVLGLNGSGKSSLLRIMAGEDDGYTGEARLTPGFTVGHLAQEPVLDAEKDVEGNVLDGVAATRDLLARYDAVMADNGPLMSPPGPALETESELDSGLLALSALLLAPTSEETIRWADARDASRGRRRAVGL